MNRKKHLTYYIIFIFCGLLLAFLIICGHRYYKENETFIKMKKHTFIDEDTLFIELPKGRLYIDKRLGSNDGVYLCNDMDWMFDCKLFQDFQWYPDAYCVCSSIDLIHIDAGQNTRAYYQTVNDDKYIFVWEFSWPSVIHELAHFADATHNEVSQSSEWKEIYEKEWTENDWLKGYTKESLSPEEQMRLFLKESFAEGFAQWYVSDYRDKYYASYYEQNIAKNDIPGTIENDSIEVDRDKYPLTYEYMDKFYAQYEFSESYLEAVKYGNAFMNWD